jgi:hypothetical protein
MENNPRVAFDGTNYLIAWDHGWYGSTEIRAARIGTSGAALDATPIEVAAGNLEKVQPDVAFGAGTFLVAWDDARTVPGSSTYPPVYDVFAARVTSDGRVLDPGGAALTEATNVDSRPAVAWDGAQFLVSWQAQNAGGGRGDDCVACSVAAGGATDGVCTPLDGVACACGECRAGVCEIVDASACADGGEDGAQDAVGVVVDGDVDTALIDAREEAVSADDATRNDGATVPVAVVGGGCTVVPSHRPGSGHGGRFSFAALGLALAASVGRRMWPGVRPSPSRT